MSLFAISRIVDAKGSTIGLGIVETTTGEFKKVPFTQAEEFIKRGAVKIENLEIVNGKLEGANGSIDRLTKTASNGSLLEYEKLTIINAITDGEKTVEFDIANTQGVITRTPYQYMLNYAKSYGLSNAKVVMKDGKEYLSAIKGNFNTIVIPPKKEVVEQPAEPVGQTTYDSYLDNYNKTSQKTAFSEGFNKRNLATMHNEIPAALKGLEEKYGIKFKSAGISYGSDKFTMKLECFISTSGKPVDQLKFEEYCYIWDLSPEDYGRRFQIRGDIYEICGCRPKADKYGILGKSIADGKVYKFQAEGVKRNLI